MANFFFLFFSSQFTCFVFTISFLLCKQVLNILVFHAFSSNILSRDRSRIFSIKEADCQRNIKIFVISVQRNLFLSSKKHQKYCHQKFCQNYFDKVYCAEGKVLRKKHANNAVFGQFLEILDQKELSFFWHALLFKISIYWFQRRL